MLVDIQVETTKGKQLPTFSHEGRIYVAGKKEDRYNIHITNRTSARIEVVVSVDGRDVISGEKGSIESRGYILSAFGTAVVEGFRQSDDRVAAFRFSGKGDSYSAKMGTKENVGIIGIAVFQELFVPPTFVYQPPPIVFTPSHQAFGVNINEQSSRPRSEGDVNYSADSISVNSVSAPATGSFTTNSPPVSGREVSDFSPTHSRGGGILRSKGISKGTKTEGRQGFRGDQKRSRVKQEIGTEYGESIMSRVGSTHFTRARETPDELWQIWYDTMSALRKKGVSTKRRPKVVSPNPFPDTPYVADGFAKPPPR